VVSPIRGPIVTPALVGALAIAACGWRSPTVPTGPPVLLSVAPAGGAFGLPVVTAITLRWNVPMAAGQEHFVDLHVGGLGGPLVPLVCLWSANRTLLTCRPTATLQAGTPYTVHVGGGMVDEKGQPIDMERYGMGFGGRWVVGGMTTGLHAGSPWGLTGEGGRRASESIGMAFNFTTA